MDFLEPIPSALTSVSLALGTGAALLILGFTGAPLSLWTLAGATLLYGLGVPPWVWVVFAIPAVLFNIRPLRRSHHALLGPSRGSRSGVPRSGQSGRRDLEKARNTPGATGS